MAIPSQWIVIAPIEEGGQLRGTPLPIVLTETICITDVPEWFRADNLTLGFENPELKRLQREAEYCISVHHQVDSTNHRMDDPEVVRGHNRAYEDVMLVQAALWLIETPLLIRHVTDNVRTREGQWVMRGDTEIRHVLSAPGTHRDGKVSADELVALFRPIRQLADECTVRVAINVMLKALGESDWIIRYLCYWLAMEALFGAEDGREIRFRLSLRAALVLQASNRDRKVTFDLIKSGYDWRSKVVHGVRLRGLNLKDSEKLMRDLESLVRDSLRVVLRNAALTEALNGRQRESYLDNLIFSEQTPQ